MENKILHFLGGEFGEMNKSLFRVLSKTNFSTFFCLISKYMKRIFEEKKFEIFLYEKFKVGMGECVFVLEWLAWTLMLKNYLL